MRNISTRLPISWRSTSPALAKSSCMARHIYRTWNSRKNSTLMCKSFSTVCPQITSKQHPQYWRAEFAVMVGKAVFCHAKTGGAEVSRKVGNGSAHQQSPLPQSLCLLASGSPDGLLFTFIEINA